MSNYYYILDNGHGGIVNGEYVTSGKRSPIWPDGRQLFEGVFNRQIVQILSKLLDTQDIDYDILVPEDTDISLQLRVDRANLIYRKHKNAIFISIHGNAGGGTGYEIFTSPGFTKSDIIAPYFFDEMEKMFPTMRMRSDMSDGDVDKEARYKVLTKTNMPAILTESFFFDTFNPDCEIMMSEEGRNRIALAHLNAILKLEKEKPI